MHPPSSHMTDDSDRVVQFRPRPAGGPPVKEPVPATASAPAEPDRLSDHMREQVRPAKSAPLAPDDYRHRIMTNLAAAAIAVLLAGCGVWLANSLHQMRQTQDCVMMGLRNCAPISSHSPLN